jgi:hypothetical protein
MWYPNLGPRFGTRFGTPIWNPDLGPCFWDPILDVIAGHYSRVAPGGIAGCYCWALLAKLNKIKQNKNRRCPKSQQVQSVECRT